MQNFAFSVNIPEQYEHFSGNFFPQLVQNFTGVEIFEPQWGHLFPAPSGHPHRRHLSASASFVAIHLGQIMINLLFK
jgi:hypothetical protein